MIGRGAWSIIMALRDDLLSRREHHIAIAARHGATNLRLFGSVLRHGERPDSNVDLLKLEVAPPPESRPALRKRATGGRCIDRSQGLKAA